MKPIVLKMNAFGPYQGLQQLDFSQLKNDELFLITGKTGAGKTSIFDAICLALYGTATSDKRLPQNFKSDYALKSDICFVELTFSINSKIYNIKRIPTQVKVKRNGEEKIEQQSAILTLPNKEILSSINEINQKINEIIGLDISQFRQIVMLPQGEFRKMLEANSKQKEVIFRKIFKTEIYNNLTDKLKKLYDDSYEELKTCQNNIKIYYKSLFTENEELKNIISSDYANVNIILKKFKEQQTEYKNIIKKINIEKALVENQLKALDISQSKKIYNDFINLENYKNEILKLNNQSEIIKSDKILLEKIKNAIKLSPDFTLLIEKKSAIEKAEKEYLLENKNKKQILVLFNEEKENFEKSKINYDLIDELVKENEKISENIFNLKINYEKLQKLIDIFSKEEENYNNQKITNEKLNAIKIINEYNNLLKQKNTLQQCELNYNLLKKIEKEYQILSKKYDEELLSFYNAQAYILSQKLKKDERCPVCGSKNHPILPNKPEKYLNEIEINEIKNQLNILAQTVKNYETNFAISFENCKQFFNLDNKDIIQIFKLIKNIENQIIVSKTNFLNCNKLISSFDTEDAILKEHEKNNNIADSLLTQKNKAIIELNLPLETLKIDVLNACKKNEELQKNYKTKSENINYKIKMYKIDFEKAREEYNKTNTNLKSITDMLEKLEMIGKKSRKEAVLYSKMFLENCLKNGFNNENEFIEIYEQIYSQDDIEKRINDFEDKYLSAQKGVEILQEQLKETEKPNIEEVIKKNNDIKEKIKIIDKKISDNTLKYQSNKNNLEKLEKEFDKYQDVEKNVSKYEKLYDVSRGKNSQKLSFESYILSAYFKYIINTANLRLQKMTDSRYKLYKKEELARNGASSGLEMTVFDAYTGKTRETSTLSGGESFKVSLSLALGLADIIEQSSGGIFIETMFIDEGFGSLDSSSLDNAINTLFDLKNNGRLVGIISHVESLKEKIETKLIVESNNGGSTAYFSKK